MYRSLSLTIHLQNVAFYFMECYYFKQTVLDQMFLQICWYLSFLPVKNLILTGRNFLRSIAFENQIIRYNFIEILVQVMT